MKKLLVSLALPLMFSLTTQAAVVEIEWVDPSEFTDIKPSNESKKRFQARTFKKIEKYVSQLAEKLPEEQILKLSVTDLDLAGRVEFASNAVINTRGGFTRLGLGFSNDIRIVDSIDFPRMEFAYELVSNQGDIIVSGEENLKDLNFQYRAGARVRSSDTLRHEKFMIRDWFNQTFEEQQTIASIN